MKKTVFYYTEEQLRRYIIDKYYKYGDGRWVLHEQIDTDGSDFDVVNGKIIVWSDRERGKFSELNMDFNSPNYGACFKINRSYQKDDYIVSQENILEFTINGIYYYIQKETYRKRIKGHSNFIYTINDSRCYFRSEEYSYTKKGIMAKFNKRFKKRATICA